MMVKESFDRLRLVETISQSWLRRSSSLYGVDMDSYEFSKRLYHETGALVTPGGCFKEPGCVRVGYACKESELREGLAVMGDFIEKLKKAGN